MNNKNILFIIVVTLCVISLFVGLLTPAKYKNSQIETQKVQDKSSFNKIITTNFNKVAIISLNGVISSTPEKNIFVEENSSINALMALNKAENDNSVKGVILKINSPGGTVAMSQRLYSAVMNLRKKKPVISVMDDVAASGGYYVASATDRIVAMPGTLTGSIGVIMSTMDMHKLLTDKLGINENVIKSGKFKDIGSSTRAMTNPERALLQDMVDDSYLQFKEAIITGRINRNDNYEAKKAVLSINNLNKYADGRVFTGRQALKLGFIDSTGGMREATTMMKSMVAQKNPTNFNVQFVEYGRANNIFDAISMNQTSSSIEDFLPQSVKYARKPLYLWE